MITKEIYSSLGVFPDVKSSHSSQNASLSQPLPPLSSAPYISPAGLPPTSLPQPYAAAPPQAFTGAYQMPAPAAAIYSQPTPQAPPTSGFIPAGPPPKAGFVPRR